jgi:hypothetical protein
MFMLGRGVNPEGRLQKPTKDKVEANFIQARKGNLKGVCGFSFVEYEKAFDAMHSEESATSFGAQEGGSFSSLSIRNHPQVP